MLFFQLSRWLGQTLPLTGRSPRSGLHSSCEKEKKLCSVKFAHLVLSTVCLNRKALGKVCVSRRTGIRCCQECTGEIGQHPGEQGSRRARGFLSWGKTSTLQPASLASPYPPGFLKKALREHTCTSASSPSFLELASPRPRDFAAGAPGL